MEPFICGSERGDPVPAVLTLTDAPGIQDELYDMARHHASVGYVVPLSNLYYQAGRDTEYDYANVMEHGSDEHSRIRVISIKMTIPPVMRDVGTMLTLTDADPAIRSDPVGTHGHCMSGQYSLTAAAR